MGNYKPRSSVSANTVTAATPNEFCPLTEHRRTALPALIRPGQSFVTVFLRESGAPRSGNWTISMYALSKSGKCAADDPAVGRQMRLA